MPAFGLMELHQIEYANYWETESFFDAVEFCRYISMADICLLSEEEHACLIALLFCIGCEVFGGKYCFLGLSLSLTSLPLSFDVSTWNEAVGTMRKPCQARQTWLLSRRRRRYRRTSWRSGNGGRSSTKRSTISEA